MEESSLLARAVTVAPSGLSFELGLAAQRKKPVLILCPHSSIVDDFLKYQRVTCFDCKKACLDVVLWKRKTIEEVRAEARAALRVAISGVREGSKAEPGDYINLAGTLMERNPYACCTPLWLSFGSSSFHVSGLIHEKQGLPLAVLMGSYSPHDGVASGILSHREALRVDESTPFNVILTSQLSVADAEKFLAPVVPGLDNMTIINVDVKADVGSDYDKVQQERRVQRPLPVDALAKVEAAILANDEDQLKTAIGAAKEYWAENGRYLSPGEQDTVGKQGRIDGRDECAKQQIEIGSAGPERDGATIGRVHGVDEETKLARLRSEYSAATDTAAVEMEAWTILDITDWVAIDDVWVEIASNADEEWQEL
mmetsp:Transcript_99803/g.213711  ORF Transcript_99803/g.213711 Transcript_99803/m.213711 type:complete len:369 (+) Transcript_99803:311-1417(+)